MAPAFVPLLFCMAFASLLAPSPLKTGFTESTDGVTAPEESTSPDVSSTPLGSLHYTYDVTLHGIPPYPSPLGLASECPGDEMGGHGRAEYGRRAHSGVFPQQRASQQETEPQSRFEEHFYSPHHPHAAHLNHTVWATMIELISYAASPWRWDPRALAFIFIVLLTHTLSSTFPRITRIVFFPLWAIISLYIYIVAMCTRRPPPPASALATTPPNTPPLSRTQSRSGSPIQDPSQDGLLREASTGPSGTGLHATPVPNPFSSSTFASTSFIPTSAPSTPPTSALFSPQRTATLRGTAPGAAVSTPLAHTIAQATAGTHAPQMIQATAPPLLHSTITNDAGSAAFLSALLASLAKWTGWRALNPHVTQYNLATSLALAGMDALSPLNVHTAITAATGTIITITLLQDEVALMQVLEAYAASNRMAPKTTLSLMADKFTATIGSTTLLSWWSGLMSFISANVISNFSHYDLAEVCLIPLCTAMIQSKQLKASIISLTTTIYNGEDTWRKLPGLTALREWLVRCDTTIRGDNPAIPNSWIATFFPEQKPGINTSTHISTHSYLLIHLIRSLMRTLPLFPCTCDSSHPSTSYPTTTSLPSHFILTFPPTF